MGQLPMFASLRTSTRRIQDGVPELADESVDVSFFSPPYHEQHGYSDGLMFDLGRLLARSHKPGTRIFMNFGRVSEAPGREYDARAALLEGAGEAIQPAQDFVWVKSIAVGGWKEKLACPKCAASFEHEARTVCRGHVTPLNSERIVNNGFEHVFQFTKGPPDAALPYDRLSVGVEYADPGNLVRGTRGKNGNLRCRGDVVYLPYRTTGHAAKKAHPHAFPAALVRHFLLLARVPEGGLVLDPFSGGGTTAGVARSLGLNAFANDADPTAIEATLASWARVDELVKANAAPAGSA